ncbi:hypothetical protein K438DRAFT_1857623 [Mycena galopus ATCC 62051]|nr:hypothetical protein K438DRAFT_1857623 [Mycena galopus ATCC 62051]
MLSLFALAPFVSTSIAVKPIHSHNDYLHAVPFWDALNLSIMSVEAGVWWQSSQLFTKTLDSLYLDNILGIINGTVASATPTFQPVFDALQPRRAGGRLTTYASGQLTQGAVTVTIVGTGNTPLASVPASNPRDIFLLRRDTKPAVGLEFERGPEIAPLESVDYANVTWNTFWTAGSNWVNADDLLAVSDAWAVFNATAAAGSAVVGSDEL